MCLFLGKPPGNAPVGLTRGFGNALAVLGFSELRSTEAALSNCFTGHLHFDYNLSSRLAKSV